MCHTCASDDPRNATTRYNHERLVRCIRCPTAYHTGKSHEKPTLYGISYGSLFTVMLYRYNKMSRVICLHFKHHLHVFYVTCFKGGVPPFSIISQLLLDALFLLAHPLLA